MNVSAFGPLWERHQMTKLASICYTLIGFLIVSLVFITVVNILLCLINKLSDKSHIDTEKKHGIYDVEYLMFQTHVMSWHRSIQDEWVTACPLCFWLSLLTINSHLPRLTGFLKTWILFLIRGRTNFYLAEISFQKSLLYQITVAQWHQNPTLPWCPAPYPVSSAWAVP